MNGLWFWLWVLAWGTSGGYTLAFLIKIRRIGRRRPPVLLAPLPWDEGAGPGAGTFPEERWAAWQVRLQALPLIAALGGVGSAPAEAVTVGPWLLDRLGWVAAAHAAGMNFLLQRYARHHLRGDRRFAEHLAGLSFVSLAVSLTWLAGDGRLFLFGWTATAAAVLALIALRRERPDGARWFREAAATFGIAWAAVVAAVVGSADLARSWSLEEMARVAAAGPGAAALWGALAVGAMAMAGAYPFHRWLLASPAAPTPVSAVLHAGVVNAGGLLFARWSGLAFGEGATAVSPGVEAVWDGVIVWAWASAMLGFGMMAVAVDVKRKLAASTMAQMGLMMTQAALGASIAAVLHLLFHGWFKATLFLRAGEAVRPPGTAAYPERASLPFGEDRVRDARRPVAAENGGAGDGFGRTAAPDGRRAVVGRWTAVVAGAVVFWATWRFGPNGPGALLGAFFLAGTAVFLVREMSGRPGRAAVALGTGLLFPAVISVLAREGLGRVLEPAVGEGAVRPFAEGLALVLYALGALAWLAALSDGGRRLSNRLGLRLYVGLVRLGEPRPASMAVGPYDPWRKEANQ
ncbi:proton-conducting transporter membrane subunit [Hydrogenibacillus sp. N12]|uniref:proton-conducting transporter transmembrane domain-containing protein n=1 Tax=Hydrogenibacillus sp. N12 TaxID=2866627 RepID=UPI001C7D20DD|nr:proton-conducting transporter membrane subunit [Hydrogenibacillus sp. N12]QZA32217.1 hypothetical protein K2M58_07715 [Hydrogenibacillus sp. N12]